MDIGTALLLTSSGNVPALGSLEGTITGSNGEPLKDAVVTVKGTSLIGKTDSNGYYKIPKVPAGTWTVVVGLMPKYSPQTFEGVFIRHKETSTVSAQLTHNTWELHFQLPSLESMIFLRDIPGYDPEIHQFTDEEFFGVPDDDWDNIGREVWVEVIYLGTNDDPHHDPHPVYLWWDFYSWDPPNSLDGHVTWDSMIERLEYTKAHLGTRYYKLVRYDSPVNRVNPPY